MPPDRSRDVAALLGRGLYAGSAVAEADRRTMALGLRGSSLMELAGKAVAERVATMRPSRVVVCAGPGNNGGDGFVAARWLRHWGVHAVVWALDAAGAKGDAGDAARQWRAVGGKTVHATSLRPRTGQLRQALCEADVVVDALVGTGLRGRLRPASAAWAQAISDAGARLGGPRVVAVDVPSGVQADDGTLPGPVVQADVTVTMGLPKLALHIWPARKVAGDIQVVDLGYPDAVVRKLSPAGVLLDPDPAMWLERPRDGHKGTFGTVGVIGGSRGMPGAAALAARGALRAGAGKVVVGSERGGHARLPAEVIRRGGHGDWGAMPVATVLGWADGADAAVIGPGMGRTEGAAAVVRGFLSGYPGPCVVDADALALLPRHRLRRNVVLTPHPGEAAVILGLTTAAVQSHRLDAVRQLQARTGGCVVLKGAGTLIFDGSRLGVSPWANPGLAVPGSGDVLAGVIGALLAAGYEPWVATCLGVWVHGAAGERLGRDRGNLAGEIADAIPAVLGGRGSS